MLVIGVLSPPLVSVHVLLLFAMIVYLLLSELGGFQLFVFICVFGSCKAPCSDSSASDLHVNDPPVDE